MKKIYKYTIESQNVSSGQEIYMPEGAVPLTMQSQDGYLQLWCKVDAAPSIDFVAKTFLLVWTGRDFDDTNMTYIATAQHDHLVYHLFEVNQQ